MRFKSRLLFLNNPPVSWQAKWRPPYTTFLKKTIVTIWIQMLKISRQLSNVWGCR